VLPATSVVAACAMQSKRQLFIKGFPMKKINVDADLKRSKFLIRAMVLQVILVLVAMFCYWIYLKS
jgi:hypothetical protein